MLMRVIAKATILKFIPGLPKAEQAQARAVMLAWHAEITAASWSNFAEVKKTFNTADWITDGKVVFDIGGNKYRVVCLLGFKSKRAFVLFAGTHKQYDAIKVKDL